MYRPYVLHASSAILSLNSRLNEQVNHWLEQWVSEKDIPAEIHVFSETIKKKREQKMYSACYVDGINAITISVDEALYINFPDFIIPLMTRGNKQHSDIVSHVLNSIFFDLLKPYLKEFFHGITEAGITEAEITEAKTLRSDYAVDFIIPKNSGDVIIEIEFSKGSVYLQLPYCVIRNVNNYKHDASADKKPLSSRENCQILGNIKLVVNAGDTQVDFGAVLDMQVGDVIQLNSKINDKMKITTSEGDFICAAHLGRQRNNKAIKVVI